MFQKLLFAGLFALVLSACQKDDHAYAYIDTDFGTMKVMLYEETPLHSANFLKLAEQGFYDSLLFHRVMENFMIQGGDPDSKYAGPAQMLGSGGPGYQTPQEIGFPHFKGVLAAATNGNPEKSSSGSQFYIVQGTEIDNAILDQIEQKKGFTYSEAQRKLYLQEGGYPYLDGDYTVFGELVDGFDVLDSIAAQPVGAYDRPLQDIRMKIRVPN